MTIRWRLAFWYGGVFTLILLLVLGLNYAFYVQEQYRSIDAQMRQSALQIEASWGLSPSGSRLVDRSSELFMVVRFYDPQGNLRQTSHPWLSLPPTDPRQALQNPDRPAYDRFVEFLTRLRSPPPRPPDSVFTLTESEGERWRVYVHPLRSGPETAGYLEALVPLDWVDQNVRVLARNLSILALLAVALVFAIGFWIARRALSPLDRLTSTAQDIAQSKDLTWRVKVPPGRDELSRLAQTFNGMLGALQTEQNAIKKAEAELARLNRDLEERVRERTAELEQSRQTAEFLAALGDALQGAGNPQEVADAAFPRLGRGLGASYVAFSRREGEQITLSYVWGDIPPRLEEAAHKGIWREQGGMLWRVVEEGRALYTPNYAHEPYHLPLGLEDWAVGAEPIRERGGAVVATLSVGRPSAAGPWRENERDLMARAAAAIGLALERAEMNERLEASMNQAVEAAQLGLWDWELASGEIRWGGYHAELYGFPPGTPRVLVSDLEGLVFPEDRERIVAAVNRAVAEGRAYDLEYRIRRQDTGELRWMYVRGKPVPDPAGRVVRVRGTLQDVTERKEAEERLYARERFIARVADTTPGLIYVFDLKEDRNVFTNAQLTPLFGYTPEELRGMGEGFIFRLVHPDDLEKIRHTRQRLAQAGDGEVHELEYRFLHKDGSWRWLRGRDTVLERDPQAQPRLVLGLAEDITEHKRIEEDLRSSEARLSLAFDAAGMGWWEWNVQTDQHFWSAGFERLLGLERGSFRGGAGAFLERVHPDDRERVRGLIQKTGEGSQPRPREFEYRVVHPDGRTRWIVSRAKVYHDERGNVERLIGVDLDITERHEALERLTFLQAVTVALSGTHTPQEVGRVITERVLSVLGARGGLVGLLSADGRSLELVGKAGYAEEIFREHSRVSLESGVPLAEAVRTGVPVFVQSPQEYAERAPEFAERVWSTPLRAVVAYPMRFEERLIGGLAMGFDSIPQFQGEDRVLLETLLEQCAQALERARLFEAERRALEEREKANAQLAAMLDNLPLGLAFFDRDLRYVRVNPEIARMNSRAPEEHLGRHLEEILPTFGPLLRPRIEEVFSTGQGLYNVEISGPSPLWDGEVGYVLASWFPVKTQGETELVGAVVLDITRRKRAEEALRASEAKLAGILQNMPAVVYLKQADGSLSFVNQQFEQVFGLSNPEVIGKTQDDLFPQAAEAIRRNDLEVLRQGGVHTFEETVPHADGSSHTYLSTKFALRDEGEAYALVGISVDITERLRSEEALRRSEARFRRVVESRPVGILFANEEGLITAANEVLLEMLGYTRDELIGKPWADLTPPEYRELDAWAVQEILDKGSVAPYEKAYIRKDGSLAPILIGATMLEGERFEVVGFVVDITERKRAEETIRFQASLLDAVDQAVIATDLEGRITYWNRYAEKLYGWSGPEVMGRLVQEVTPAEFAQGQAEEIMRALMAGESWSGEFYVHRKDGSVFPVLVTDSPIRDAWGVPVGIVGVSVDISERKRASERLEALQAVTSSLVGVSSLEAVYAVILEQGIAVLGARAGAVSLLGPDGRVRIAAHRGHTPQVIEAFRDLPLEGLYPVTDAIRERQTLYFRTALERNRRYPHLVALFSPSTHSSAYIPLRTDGAPLGALTLSFPQENAFDQDEREFITALADACAQAMQRARLFESLRHSEERFRTMAETLPGFVWIDSAGGINEYMNTRWTEFTGQPADDAGGQGWIAATHPDDIPRVEKLWARCRETGEAYESELRHRRHDGTYHWFLARALPLYDATGKIARWVGTSINIEDRKQAELAVKASEERYRALVQASAQLVWTTDAKGFNATPQPSWLEFTGQSWEEEQGWGWLEAIHPDDRERVRASWAGAIQRREPYLEIQRLRRWDGEYRYMEVRAVPVLNADGTVREWVGTHTDITERKMAEDALKESEERFRLVADGSPLMIWVTDVRGGVEFANRAYREFFGVSLEQVRGPNWQPLVHPDDAEPYITAFLHSVREHRPFHGQARVRRADGEWRWIESYANPRFSASGEYLGHVGSSPDITERKKAEDDLRASEERLRNLVEAQKRFVADASHELRAPLTAIQGNLELLQRFKHMSKSDREEALGEAGREAARLARLVNDMLALARGDAGVELKREPVNLTALLRQAFDEARHLGQSHRLELGYMDEIRLEADGDRVKQLAIILLDNAVKYTPAGGRVRLELRKQGEMAEFRVTDSGVGIAPEDLSRVFERFYRADQSRQRDPGGTGLGLPIARWIVEQHKGRIWLESEVGQGTTAIVQLPLPVNAAQPPEPLFGREER